MTTPELIGYVKSEVEKGTARDVIASKLKLQGWTDLDVIEVFDIVNPTSYTPTDPIPTVEVVPNQSIKPSPIIEHTTTPFVQPISLNQYPLHNQNINPVVNTVATGTSSPLSGISTMGMHSAMQIQPKSGHTLLKSVIFIFIFLVLLVGGAIVYASGYFITSATIFSKISDSSKNNKTVKFEANLNIDATNMKIPEGSFSLGSSDAKTADLNMTGAFDMSDSTKPKFDSSYLFKMGKIDAGIAIRMIDGSLYFNFIKAPDLGFFSLKPFENRWVSVPVKTQDGKLDTTNPLLAASPIDTNIFSNITDEQKTELANIMKKANFIKLTKKNLPQMVDGAISYHLSFDIDKVALISFMTELTNFMKSIDKSNDSLATLEPTDYSKSLDSISSFSGELWVGIFDNLPHKIIINSTIINPEKPEDGSVKLFLTILYKDWNKPITVEVPAKAVTVEELTKELFGGMAGDASTAPALLGDNSTDAVVSNNTNGVVSTDNTLNVSTDKKYSSGDANKISIMTNMRAKAEIYFSNSKSTYKGFCSNKTENGGYTSAITLPKGSVYKCNDVATAWASWVKLGTNEYYCVDSTGVAKSSMSTPTGTSCPK